MTIIINLKICYGSFFPRCGPKRIHSVLPRGRESLFADKPLTTEFLRDKFWIFMGKHNCTVICIYSGS